MCLRADIEGELAEELEEHLDDDDFWEDDFESEAEVFPYRCFDVFSINILIGRQDWELPLSK
jgi:hypothetical protein